jgi:hypothetical protein
MNPNGMIVYEGPSAIDGAPIVVILTGLAASSANGKTGDLVQSFVIRADIEPHVAVQTGDDASVCGMCEHRPALAKLTGKAPCYVRTGESVLSVYRAYKRGSYPRAQTVDQVRSVLAGRRLRLGTYGDPYAAPVALWQTMVEFSDGHVGYSHQWQSVGFDVDAWAPLLMASVDTAHEAAQAQALGMRYFRVSIGIDRRAGEVSCPASAEGGRRAQCSDCMLCAGTTKRARSIVIADHASGHARRVIAIQSAV